MRSASGKSRYARCGGRRASLWRRFVFFVFSLRCETAKCYPLPLAAISVRGVGMRKATVHQSTPKRNYKMAARVRRGEGGAWEAGAPDGAEGRLYFCRIIRFFCSLPSPQAAAAPSQSPSPSQSPAPAHIQSVFKANHPRMIERVCWSTHRPPPLSPGGCEHTHT